MREREKQKGAGREQSKYGSFEFCPSRQIGSASEARHMKTRNLGEILHSPARRSAQMKLPSMWTPPPPPQPLSSSPSRNPPSLPLSAYLPLQLLTSPPLPPQANICIPGASLASSTSVTPFFSSRYVNPFLCFLLFH